MKQIIAYGTAYLLWAVTLAFSTALVIALRTTYHFALDRTEWSSYSLGAIDKFATVLLAVTLVFIFVLAEHAYRTAVSKQRLWPRFCQAAAIGMGVLAVNQGVRLLLEWSIGQIDWSTVALLLVALAGTVGFARLNRFLRKQQRSPRPTYRNPHERPYHGARES